MSKEIIICDLDGTLIPYDSTSALIRNNKKKLHNIKKYSYFSNYVKALFDVLKTTLGFNLNRILFFKQEKVEFINNLIENEFSNRNEFNTQIIRMIEKFDKIVILTGSSEIIAKKIISKLPVAIQDKIEIIGSVLEIKKDQFTGKIIQHPYGFYKRKIIKERLGSDSLVGVGNSIYDIPFLSKCKKGYLLTNKKLLKILVALFYRDTIKCI